MKKLFSVALAVSLLLALSACGKPAVAIPNPPLVMGEKYLSDLDYEQALLQFDQAIQIDPKNPRGHLGKADALLNLDRQEEAAEALNTAVKAVSREQREPLRAAQAEVAREPVDGFLGIAGAYERLGLKELALSLVKRAVQKFPKAQKLLDAWLRLSADQNDATYFEGSVYQVFDEGMTWYEAKAYCESVGGHLATITSQAEQDYIEGLLVGYNRNVYWLGGTNRTQSGQWEWITGEPFEFTNWIEGEPNNYNGNEYYVEIHRVVEPGEWNDLPYSGYALDFSDGFFLLNNIGFICEWKSGYQASAKSIPSDAAYFEGSAYKLYGIGMPWHEAKAYCDSIGGHLVTITSQAEQDFITELIRNSSGTDYWIGLSDEAEMWRYEWVTGEEYGYSHWATGWPQPDHSFDGAERYIGTWYVEGWTDIGDWNDFLPQCGLGFICEWSIVAD